MVNRRMLRAKALQTFYAANANGEMSLDQANKALFLSIDRLYHLYLLMVRLLLDLRDYAENRLEIASHSKLEENRANSKWAKFVHNRALLKLNDSSEFLKAFEQHHIQWNDARHLIKHLFTRMTESPGFIEWLDNGKDSMGYDKQILLHILAEVLNHDEELAAELEKMSIYWNDDLEFVLTAILKTINGINKENNFEPQLPELFYNQEDRDFVKELLRISILQKEENSQIIQLYTPQWDIERLVQMDLLVLLMAIAEIRHFESIPVKVSINEYIELAKQYGTPKSGVFINGVLDKVVTYMKEKELYEKQGRGLIGNL